MANASFNYGGGSMRSVRSENYFMAQDASFQMSRTEAEHILQSGLVLSLNAYGWLATLCKDICTLMNNGRMEKQISPESARQSMEGLFQVL